MSGQADFRAVQPRQKQGIAFVDRLGDQVLFAQFLLDGLLDGNRSPPHTQTQMAIT
jgi:hypothetical protein